MKKPKKSLKLQVKRETLLPLDGVTGGYVSWVCDTVGIQCQQPNTV